MLFSHCDSAGSVQITISYLLPSNTANQRERERERERKKRGKERKKSDEKERE
jgi:hypothetical protein